MILRFVNNDPGRLPGQTSGCVHFYIMYYRSKTSKRNKCSSIVIFNMQSFLGFSILANQDRSQIEPINNMVIGQLSSVDFEFHKA